MVCPDPSSPVRGYKGHIGKEGYEEGSARLFGGDSPLEPYIKSFYSCLHLSNRCQSSARCRPREIHCLGRANQQRADFLR